MFARWSNQFSFSSLLFSPPAWLNWFSVGWCCCPGDGARVLVAVDSPPPILLHPSILLTFKVTETLNCIFEVVPGATLSGWTPEWQLLKIEIIPVAVETLPLVTGSVRLTCYFVRQWCTWSHYLSRQSGLWGEQALSNMSNASSDGAGTIVFWRRFRALPESPCELIAMVTGPCGAWQADILPVQRHTFA